MFYRVLGNPVVPENPHYKGVYRQEPLPASESGEEFISLWKRYSAIYDMPCKIGITTELSILELKRFSELASERDYEEFEVVEIRMEYDPLDFSKFYGIDVVARSGYSIVGEGLFRVPSDDSDLRSVLKDANCRFDAYLNKYALFEKRDHANAFLQALNEINHTYPGVIESEDWVIVYIYKVDYSSRP